MEGDDWLFFKVASDGSPWTRESFIEQNKRIPILVLDDECRRRFGKGVPTWGWKPSPEYNSPKYHKRLRRLEHRAMVEQAQKELARAQQKLEKLGNFTEN